MAQPTNGSVAHNWQIESLRLTAFPGSSMQPFAEPTWWFDLTQNQPETRISKPALGQFQEMGAFEDRILILSLQPGRIDWVLNPKPSQDGENSADFRVVGSFPSSLGLFVTPMLHWLNGAPDVIRLAFGATLIDPVGDRQTGYQRLSVFLPSVRIDPEGSEDFLYQINRPRKSALPIENPNINRLSRWSVAAYQSIRVQMAIPLLALPAQQVIQSQLREPLFACRVEMDISTSAAFQGNLPHESLGRIFEELVSLGSELARSGDIA